MTDIDFSVAVKTYADNLTDAALASAIETDLDALTVNTVYAIQIEHHAGFWKLIIIYA